MVYLPVIENENGRMLIKGFCEREYVHKKRLLHATSLVIPVLSFSTGQILTMDKCEKYIANALASGEKVPIAQLSIDLFGGHPSYDFIKSRVGSDLELTEEIMRDNAVDRLLTGLYIKSSGDELKPIEVIPKNMNFIGIYRNNDAFNYEEGFLYTYELPKRDDYIAVVTIYGKNGESKKIRLTVHEFLLSELFNMYQMLINKNSSGYNFSDGIGRLLETGDSLYKVLGMKKPESEKDAEKNLKRYTIHVNCLLKSDSADDEARTINRSEPYFGTKRDVEIRAKEILKQQNSNYNVTDSSYWIEETKE